VTPEEFRAHWPTMAQVPSVAEVLDDLATAQEALEYLRAFMGLMGRRPPQWVHGRMLEIQARIDAATPGPWECCLSPNDGDGYRVCEVQNEHGSELIVPQSPTSLPYQPAPESAEERWDNQLARVANYEFIAHSWADVNTLKIALEAAFMRIGALEAALATTLVALGVTPTANHMEED
jgi:hypothetical protein